MQQASASHAGARFVDAACTGVLLDFGQPDQWQIRNATLDMCLDAATGRVDATHPRTRAAVLGLLTASAAAQLARLGESEDGTADAVTSASAPSDLQHFALPISTLGPLAAPTLVFHCVDSPLAFNLYAARSASSLATGDSPLVRGPAFLLNADAANFPFLGSAWVELDHAVAAGLMPIFEDEVGGGSGGGGGGSGSALAASDDEDEDDEDEDEDEDEEHEDEANEDGPPHAAVDDSTGLRHRKRGAAMRREQERERVAAAASIESLRHAAQLRDLARRLCAREFWIPSPEAPDFVPAAAQ
jgi:hypothetical protein